MQLSGANFRSSAFYLARSRAPCGNCGQVSQVVALALPAGHETLVDGRWQRGDADAFIFFVTELTGPIGRRLARLAPLFTRKQGEGHRNPYWVNHCEHCGALFDDDELHCEPGIFMPAGPAEARAITLVHIAEAISAEAAGYAFDPQFIDLTSRR